jgi:hypothetical protein
MKHRYYIAEVSTQQIPTPTYIRPTFISLEVAVSVVVGVVGALGIPKLVQMFATDKMENSKSERNRDDLILKSVLEVNRTMMATSASTSVEMLKLTQNLVSEIALMREVITNNTVVMEKVRIAGEELKEEMHYIKSQISYQHNDIM